jgi:predicted nucleic acid-binding protein
MSKVFIDTNVVLDLLAKHKPYPTQSLQLFSLADKKELDLVISTLSIVNVHYILSERMKIKDSRSILGKFKVLVNSYELNDKIIDLALNDFDFKDFEDGLQYYTALESQCDLIVTRNVRDFKESAIPVLSPREYLTKINAGR